MESVTMKAKTMEYESIYGACGMRHETPFINDIITKARQSLHEFDSIGAESAVREAFNAGIDPVELIESGFVEGMKDMGDLYEVGEINLLHILVASRIMEECISMIESCAKENDMDLRFFGNIATHTQC